MKNIAIIGSTDLGQQIAYQASNMGYNVVGFFDDFVEKYSLVKEYKVLGKLLDIEEEYDKNTFDEIIIGIGYKHLNFREQVFNDLKDKLKFATLIHSSCYVDNSSNIGQGVCLFPGTIIDQNVVVKDNVLVNINCSIAHDSVINEHTFLSPNVAVSGFVTIGKRCNIGVSTTIIDSIKISDDVQTGGGTVVIEDLFKKGLYVGNPSRFIRG